jgi:hypothetical protein
VDHRPPVSSPPSYYNDFLFAPVCEESNGMRLSVLSALARMNVDPWEEATRLAAMPKAIAEKTLVSILDLVCGRSWKPPEAQAIAVRLVRLLPQPCQAATMAATGSAKSAAQLKSYWWVWVGFALAMSLLSPQHQAATTNAGAATSESGAASHSKSNLLVPNAVGQSR